MKKNKNNKIHENRIQLNIPMISWKNEPIKIELDIQVMVINQ